MAETQEYPHVYFISSVRIQRPEQQKYWFNGFWFRLRWTLTHLLKRKSRIKYGPEKAGFVEQVKFWFKEGWQKRFPVETRTWGYYFNKDTAFQRADENHTDLHECYYTWVVIEKVYEGINHGMSDERWFWEWDKVQEKFFRLSQPPQRLIEEFDKHQVYFSFTQFC